MPSPVILPRGQSKRMSLAEAILNVLIGFWISVLANWLVLPAWGYSVSARQAIEIGIVFTFISLARSYLLRRFFNLIHTRPSA
jgi:hypothetical protein